MNSSNFSRVRESLEALRLSWSEAADLHYRPNAGRALVLVGLRRAGTQAVGNVRRFCDAVGALSASIRVTLAAERVEHLAHDGAGLDVVPGLQGVGNAFLEALSAWPCIEIRMRGSLLDRECLQAGYNRMRREVCLALGEDLLV